MPPLFTIGIPVYNAMPYLRETMESVLAQSDSEFDILVINDGSRDDSREYLQSLRDPRLRLIHQENRKLTATLNRMLEEVRTPWLVRLDADDIALPGRIARIRQQVQRCPDAGMFYTRAFHLNHSKAISIMRSSEGTAAELREETNRGYLLSICHSSVVLNVEKTRSLGGYRFNLHVEDLDLWWRMALAYDIEFIPEVTVAYRLNNASVCINNLNSLAHNTLYVQHLLLAHLRNLPALPYETVQVLLQALVNQRRLRYRETMWKAAIHLAERRRGRAMAALTKAFLIAPDNFAERALYPLKRNKRVRVGEEPRCLHQALMCAWNTTPNLVSAH